MSRTCVVAAARGYPWVRYATFVLPLRLHYSGDIIFLGERATTPPDALALLDDQRVALLELRGAKACAAGAVQCPQVGIARFQQVAEVCRAYELCLMVDMRDAFVQADPFATLVHEHGHASDLLLSCEDDKRPIGRSFFNKGWALKCFGAAWLAAHGRRCIVNSGAIFGTAAVFELLSRELMRPCPLTTEVFHGRDQILLNGLVYSGALRNVSHQLQRRGEGLVNTVRYAFEALPRATRWNYAPEEAAAAAAAAAVGATPAPQSRPSPRSRRSAVAATRFFPHRLPFSIFNGDNATLSAVVHQYDVDKALSRALDAAALVYQNTSSSVGAMRL